MVNNAVIYFDDKSADLLGINDEGDFEALWTIENHNNKGTMLQIQYHRNNIPFLQVSQFRTGDIEGTIIGLKEFLLENDYEIKHKG